MSEKVDRKRRARRQAIFDAAARQFAENGYHATRMADIADELGLQKAALYYYFDSKEALLVELIGTRVGMAVESLEQLAHTNRPAQEKIAAAVHEHLRVFHEHADLYTIFNSEKLHAISQDAAKLVDGRGREYEELWRSMVAEGIASGDLRPDLDIAVTVKAVLGMLNTTLAWFTPGGRLTPDELADRYAKLTLAALTARG